MKIIALEGLDKSGKHSAQNAIVDYLKEEGYIVETMSFPRYDTPTGKLIWDWLRNEYDVDDHTFELIQTADKQAAQSDIQKYEESGVDYLIIDRYDLSQYAYGSYKNDDVWLMSLNHYIRRPDITIFFDVDPVVSMSRKGEHGDNDKYESDLELLTHVSKSYKTFLSFLNRESYIINANQPIQAEMLDTRALLTKIIPEKTS